jgi:hypothetical protein
MENGKDQKTDLGWSYYLWGPLVFQTKVNKKDITKIKKLCKKDKVRDHKTNLAGIIDEEYEIDKEAYLEIIKPYVMKYATAHKQWYNENIHTVGIVSAWVNFMKEMESNPNHVHANCNLSSVLYTSVPAALKKENSKYVGSLKGGGPGALTIMHGEYKPFSINNYRIFPEEGMLLICITQLHHLKLNVKEYQLQLTFK